MRHENPPEIPKQDSPEIDMWAAAMKQAITNVTDCAGRFGRVRTIAT